MGQCCFSSSGEDPAIAKAMAESKQEPIFRVLLLGAGESGKTTVMKQLSLLYGDGFDNQYKLQQRPHALANLVEGTYLLIEGGRETKYRIQEEEAKLAAQSVRQYYLQNNGGKDFTVTELDPEIADAIITLSKDPNFRKTVEYSSKFQLPDGWRYFVERVVDFPAWGGPNWLPNNEDILHVRARTTGINRKMLKYESKKNNLKMSLEVIDVGGQKAERTKWLNVFAGVRSVLYMQSMSDYDQVMFEDENKNRFEDSMELWKKHVEMPEFRSTSFILFLNKEDLMLEKFVRKRIPIDPSLGQDLFAHLEDLKLPLPPVYDPNRSEGDNGNAVSNWYATYMTNCVTEVKREQIYIHVTTAVAHESMEAIIASSLADMMMKALNMGGLIS